MPRLAPDQKIYVVSFGSTVMGVVNIPDQVFSSIDWDASGVSLPGGASTSYALPDQTYAPCEVNVPSGSCAATPVTACNEAPKAHLKIRNTGVASKNQLRWKWFKGTVNAGDFDDPTASTSYAVCVYKDGALVAAVDIEPGSNWAPISAGFEYKHPTATNADGLFKAIVKEGSGRAKILIKAKGVNLTVPAPPLDSTTNVVMQMVKGGDSGTECWESTFTAPYIKDEASVFKDKTP